LVRVVLVVQVTALLVLQAAILFLVLLLHQVVVVRVD
jgi:hypothetical protein